MSNDAQSQPDAIKPKRRGLQFGLRTLLGLVAVLAVVLTLVVVPAERQRRAAVSVESFGGRVLYDHATDSLEYRSSRERSWYGKLLGENHFSSITLVDLTRTEVTDTGLDRLKGLTRLESLNLRSTHVTDAGVARLKGLTRLASLNLWRTQVTDAGLTQLEGLTRLEFVNVVGTQVTDAGIAGLKKGLAKLPHPWAAAPLVARGPG